jgi:hypothetical protein
MQMTIDLNRLREIGWTTWDPIAFMRNQKTWIGQPFENEYDHYLIHVADRIVAGADDEELVSYLVRVECEDMYDGAIETEACRTRAAATIATIKDQVHQTALTSA